MLLPEHAPIPADRAQLFFSFLMILLFAWSQTTPATLTRNIAAGFALYGIVNLSASFWFYAVAGIYLVVVLYWFLTLKPIQTPPPHNIEQKSSTFSRPSTKSSSSASTPD